ncbi:glycosyltransferase, partial [Nocardioides sp.]|uniref:glycosyltransferase n=1 Tax=Nocardioides sp. TaxID=35761 RepID=UPI0027351502
GAKFTGALSTGDLAVALASLDVLVHPGEELTCAHTLRQAAASGVPVVAPRAGGAPAVVAHLRTGFLYDPRQEHGLRNALAAVVGDRQRSLLGEHARVWARQRSWTQAVDELVARHHSVLLDSQTRAA